MDIYVFSMLCCIDFVSLPVSLWMLRSATVDSNLFSRYFGDCPVITAEGRTHPVTTYFLEDVYESINYRLASDSAAAIRYEASSKVFLLVTIILTVNSPPDFHLFYLILTIFSYSWICIPPYFHMCVVSFGNSDIIIFYGFWTH